jgi:hypothetical protein
MAPTDDDDDKPASGELIELHTGDVQPLPPAALGKPKRFDAEETLPYPGGKPFDPEVTDPLGVPGQPAVAKPAAKPAPPVAPERLFDDVPAEPDPGGKPLSMEPSLPFRQELESAFLCVARGPGAGTSVAVPEGEHPIGRSPACFLAIAHESLSREHTLLKRAGDRFFVRDAASQSGTFVNGKRVDGTREIFAGDEIHIGEASLYLRTGPVTDPFLTAPGLDDRIHRRGPVLFWAGALATLLASAGLAAVVFTPLGERIFKRLPELRVSAPPSAPAPPPPAPEPAEPTPDLELAPSDIALDGDIEIKRAVRDFVPELPEPSPGAPVAPAPEPRPRAASPAAATTEALRLFNDSQVDQAIVAARNGGAMNLAMRIWAFRKEVRTAQADQSVQSWPGAIRHLTAAVALDDQLTRGWSKPGAQARSELTKLLIEAGERALAQKSPAQAAGLLEKALVFQPGNPRAEELLKTARVQKAAGVVPSGEGLTAEPPPPPEPKPEQPKKDSRSSAADEAFGK